MLPYPTPPFGGGLYVIRLSDTHYYGGRTKSFPTRWAVHYRLLRDGKHFNPHAQSVFDQHGRFEPEVVCVMSVDAQRAAEQEWLDEHFGQHGCVNLSRSADGIHMGYRHTEVTRAKIRARDFRDPDYRKKLSDAQKARHREGCGFSEETRRKISEGNRGRIRPDTTERNRNNVGWKHTAEALAKISEAGRTGGSKGKTRSTETKARISESLKGRIPSEETLRKRSESLRRTWAARKARGGK